MKNTFEDLKTCLTDALNKSIEDKIITTNPLYSIEGIASIFANKIIDMENANIKRSELSQIFEIMRKYYPEKFKEFVSLLEVQND